MALSLGFGRTEEADHPVRIKRIGSTTQAAFSETYDGSKQRHALQAAWKSSDVFPTPPRKERKSVATTFEKPWF